MLETYENFEYFVCAGFRRSRKLFFPRQIQKVVKQQQSRYIFPCKTSPRTVCVFCDIVLKNFLGTSSNKMRLIRSSRTALWETRIFMLI